MALLLMSAGLMTLENAATTSEQLSKVQSALKDAGCPYDDFEMTLNTAALIVLEQLHITNRGLVELKDGKPACPVSLILE